MVSPGPKIKLTYEDYAKTPDDERYELLDGELVMVPSPNVPHQGTPDDERHELIDGELVSVPTPNTLHQRTVLDLGTQLYTFVQGNKLGEVYFAPIDVVLSDSCH
jgi:Uma2 family endonuclease